MKIVVIGPGAMGCLLAGLLSKGQNEIWLLDKNEARAKNIAASGIKIEGKTELSVKVNITTKPTDIGKVDLVIIAVKSYDTNEACLNLSDIIDKSIKVLTVQNGIGNVEAITNVLKDVEVLGGVTSHGATLLGDGAIRHAGTGSTYIGRLDGEITEDIQDIAKVFDEAGIKTEISDNIQSLLWSKLIINVGINALTAITRFNNGRLVEFEDVCSIMKKAVSEAVMVADKKKIKLIYQNPFEQVKNVCNLTARNVSSMLQDVLKKKKTEIDYINLAIVRQAQELGISVPVNETLGKLVKSIESSYDKQLNN